MIPEGITTATVHMDAPVSFVGEPGRLHIVIEPSVSLIWTATGTPMGNFTDTLALDPGAELRIQLPHTDQTGFQDAAGNAYTGWFYSITVVYERNGRRIAFPERDFQIPSGQTSVDLALVPAGEAAPAPSVAPIQPVTSVNGHAGEVTMAELGLDLVDNTPDLEKPVSAAMQLALNGKISVTTPAEVNLALHPAFELTSGVVELRRNLLVNSSLESNTTGWTSLQTLVRDTSTAWTGAASGKVTHSADGNRSAYHASPAVAGKTYTLSAYIKHDAAVNRDIRIDFTFEDSTGSRLGSYASGAPVSKAAGAFNRVHAVSTVAPTGTATVRIYAVVLNMLATETMWFDGALVEDSTILEPYFDGDTAAAGDFVYAWAGTAHASASIQNGKTLTGYVQRVSAKGYQSRQGGRGRVAVLADGLNSDTAVAVNGDNGTMHPGLVAGKTYTLSATITTPVAQSGVLSTRARQIALFHKAPGDVGYTYLFSEAGPVTGSGRVSLTVTLPTGTSEAFFRLYNGSPTRGDVVYWQDLLIEEAATPSAYFDGSSTDVGDIRHAWTGTAHASTSTRKLTIESHIPDRLTDASLEAKYQKALTASAPLKLTAQTISVDPATPTAPGTISAADKAKLDATNARAIAVTAVTDAPSVYPAGYSHMSISSTDWPQQYAVAETVRHSPGRAVQRITAKLTGRSLTRAEGENDTWGAWVETSEVGHKHSAADLTTGTLLDGVLPAPIRNQAMSIGDWNTAVHNGWYMASSATNAPEATGWFMGSVERHNSVWITQTVHGFTGDTSTDTKSWRRSGNDAGGGIVWSAWYRLRISETEQAALWAARVGPNDLEITDTTKGVILKSPNGTRFRLTVGDDGALTTTAV